MFRKIARGIGRRRDRNIHSRRPAPAHLAAKPPAGARPRAAWQGLDALEPRLFLSVASEADVYDRWLCIEPGASAELQASVAVLEGELQAMTGVDFNVTTAKTTGRGIFVLRSAADLTTRYPDLASQASDLAALATTTTEGFFIYSSGADNLYIVGNTDGAVDLGVFYYLQQLGWRQLMNGDNWRIVPHRDSIRITIDSVQEPDFALRNIGASAGFNVNIPLDMDAKLASDYDFWKRATLQGGSVKGPGHMGENFNADYKAILDANYANDPHTDTEQMMAYWNGEWQWQYYGNDPENPDDYIGVKMNPSCPDLVDLFVQDRIDAYKALLTQYGPDDNRTWGISVEPADGVKYCQCPTCQANFPTVSDQIVYLAKQVADAMKAYTDSDPVMQANVRNGNVSFLAYGEHVMVPQGTNVYGQDLMAWLADPNSNYYIEVIPYGYTHSYTPMGGDELIKAWADVTADGHVGIYDYWNIPTWTMGEMAEGLDENAQRTQLWWDNGYVGFQGECGIGAPVGSMMYMATAMMYDMTVDPTAARNEFYNLAFGAAATPMKRMIERWGSGTRFTYSPEEIGQSFVDLAEARTLAANDPGALARVNDYTKYVQYLRRYYEYIDAKKHGASNAVVRDLAEAAFQSMWLTHDAGLFNTWFISNDLWRDEENNPETGDSGLTLYQDWDESDYDAWGWEWVRNNPLTSQDYADFITDGVADYGPSGTTHATIDRPAYSQTLTALNPTALDANVVQTPYFYGNEHYFTFINPSGNTDLDFRIITSATYGNKEWPAHVTVFDDTGAVVFEDDFGGDSDGGNGTWLDIALTGLTGGDTYTMEVIDRKHGFALEVPEKLPFALTGNLTSIYTSNPTAWKAYFYVPAGISKVGLFPDLSGGTYITVKDGDGTTISPSFGNGNGETDYTVASGHDAEVWSVANLDIYHLPLKPFNIPNVWSFSTYGMLVPTNIAPNVYAGGDQTIVSPTNQVSLDATVTDDGMSASAAVTKLWTKQSGPGTVTFGTPGSVDTTASFSATGTYVLRLTATDNNGAGLAAYDEVTVSYLATAPNAAPVVGAGNDATVALSGGTVNASLDGTVTDSGTPTYKWTKVEGPGTVYFANAAAVDTTATFKQVGTYTLRLAAKDAGGLEAWNEVTITVLPDYLAANYGVGENGAFGMGEDFDFSTLILLMDSTNDEVSQRFRALETVTVDRVMQRYIGLDAGTRLEVGLMADDGAGKPTGTFLASTGSYDPTDGDNLHWSVFTSPYELQYGQVYHVVTRVTALGVGEGFNVRRSGTNTDIRPYDRAYDPDMTTLERGDGGNWVVENADPFFTFGYGATPTIIQGPGQSYSDNIHNSTNSLAMQGGTGKVFGQKFQVFTTEASTGSRVVISGLSMDVYKVGTPTAGFLLSLRDASGNVLATITKAAADIGTTSTHYDWTFDGGAQVWLTPGQTYFLTSEWDGGGTTTSQYYYFRAIYTPTSPTSLAANNWGGTGACVPVESAASGSWAGYNWASPTTYAGKSQSDLWFSFTGSVVAAPVYDSGSGTFGMPGLLNYNSTSQTFNALTRVHSARFTAKEAITIDRVVQRFVGVDAGTRLEVGIMADNGNGRPDGRFLVSTGPAFDPADGSSNAWAVFTQPITLEAGRVYHLVTKMTAKGGTDTFTLNRSNVNTSPAIRPYDRGADAQMNCMTSSDGGATWADANYEPYFVLANGASVDVTEGPGQPYQTNANNRLQTRGGTYTAMGQKFKIFTTEASPATTVSVSQMTFQVYKAGTPTSALVVELRDASGTVLGTITVPAANIATASTQYTWSFDGGATVDLVPGQTYFLTTRFGGSSTSSQYYYFRGVYGDETHADATWGGKSDCVPISSGASGSWSSYNWASPTLYAARNATDLWFSFTGTVQQSMMAGGGESLMAMAPTATLRVVQATEPLKATKAAKADGARLASARLVQPLSAERPARAGQLLDAMTLPGTRRPAAASRIAGQPRSVRLVTLGTSDPWLKSGLDTEDSDAPRWRLVPVNG